MTSTPSKPARFALTAVVRYCSTITAISAVSSARCGDGRDENVGIGPISGIDRSRDRLLSCHRNVRRPAGVPKLDEHVAALGMDRICNPFPTRHLHIAVETGCAAVAAAR